MNILIVAPYALYTPHWETALEIAQKHVDSGDQVIMMGCRAELPACDLNPNHVLSVCLRCRGRHSTGLRRLSRPIGDSPLLNLTPENRMEIRNAQVQWHTIDELKESRIEAFDIGYGVLSSVVSLIENPEPDLKVHGRLIRDLYWGSLATYRSIQNILDKEKFDRVYLYNGRYAVTRAVFRAARDRGITTLAHEVGSSIHHYALWENELPHDVGPLQQRIQKAWAEAPDRVERERIGSAFFENAYKGIAKRWFSYTVKQKPDLLPSGWEPQKENIVVFASSEDEYVSISDQWRVLDYGDQLGALEAIIPRLRADSPRLHVYIRMHPNQTRIRGTRTARIRELYETHVTVIPPDDPVSSYTLLRHAKKVLTFGSTMGIEATYWGIPSVLAGQAEFRELGATYNPKNHEELITLLRNPLEPKPRETALMYGYYMNTFGEPFRYFQATSVFEGRFKGQTIFPPLSIRCAAALLQFPLIRRFARVIDGFLRRVARRSLTTGTP